MNRKISISAILLSAVAISLGASAQYPGGEGYQPPETIYNVDWTERLNPNLGLKAHDENLLGDSIDLSSGRLSFEQVDVSIPGNSDLPVEIRRRRNPSQSFNNEFEDWQLVTPSISTRINNTEFNSGDRWGKNRCSAPLVDSIPDSNYAKVYFHSEAAAIPANQYNDGVNLDVPGRGSGQLLDKTVSAGWPTAAKKVTRDGWYFTCISDIDGNGTEGFYGYAPNGDRYTFNVIRARNSVAPAEYWHIQYGIPKPMVWYHNEWSSYDILAASEVRDVHGNWVKYSYNGSGQLTSIYSNDDRRIDIAYTAGGRVSSVTANPGTSDQRTWQYNYGTKSATRYKPPAEAMGYASTYTVNYPVLSRVELPDGRSWKFNLGGLFVSAVPGTSYNAFDTTMPDNRGGLVVCRQEDQTVSITHPDGITGTFFLEEQTRFMPTSATSQYGPPCPNSNWGKGPNTEADVMAVVKKTLSAPGVPTAEWNYDYSSTVGGTSPGIPTTITMPDNTVQVQHYSVPNDYSKLLKQEVFADASSTTPLQTTEYTYILESEAGSSFVQGNMNDVTRPVRQTEVKITRNSDWYQTRLTYNTTRTSSAYSWGSPVKVEKWSSLGGGTRTTDITYLVDADDWILGLTNTVTKNGKLFDDYDYDSKGRLTSHKHLGVTVATLGYYTSGAQAGLLNWYKDALTRQTTYADWHRGSPQSITFADNTQVQYSVNDNGWVTSFTNGRGITTGYEYNNVGRVTHIDLPSPWSDTYVDYDFTGDQTIQTVSRGYKRTTTTYDAMLRPLQVLNESLSGVGDSFYQETEYDALGREIFKSLPSGSAGSSIGIQTSYDALGRVTQKWETAADGGVTDYEYLAGNKTRITDPEGYITTTTYSGYGDPSDGSVIKVEKPEGITVNQSYDIYGNLLTIAQLKNDGTTHTSTFTYDDASLRLCRRHIPENGDTLYSYNVAGEMTAYAEGQASGSGCATPPSGSAVNLSYTPRGILATTDYPDPTPDIVRAYDANGNLTSINRGGVNWTYTYNNIDLVGSETLAIDGRTFITGYGYDNDGNLTSKDFPSGRQYQFNVDGFGRPVSVTSGSETYLSAVDYHANGKIASLIRGNGGYYQQDLNQRQLVSYIGGDWGASLSYTYDSRGKVVQINSTDSDFSRYFDYDGAGRLTGAGGPWGNGSYSYDKLGNLTGKWLGSRHVDIQYDTNLNRVSSVSDSAEGGSGRSYSYDARGNVTADGLHNFTYDFANQPISISGNDNGSYVYDGNLRRVKETVGGKTIYSIYDKSGSLLTREETTFILIYTGGVDIPIPLKEVTDHITIGGQTFVRVKNGEASYPLNDHLGTAYMVADQNGTVSAEHKFVYTPFGESFGGKDPGDSNEQGFTGHIEDATGLTYMQARYYDPVTGRFLSTDPVGYADQMNLYAYVHNDPVGNVDPLGLACHPMQNVAGTSCDYTQASSSSSSANLSSWNSGSGGAGAAVSGSGAQKGPKEIVKDQLPEPGDVVRDHIQETRDDAGRNFNAQRGDASIYNAQTNCQIIRDCVARLDQYEQALNLDQSIGKDPRVQVIGELLREAGKYALCSSMNSCDLMQYYNRGQQPPPLWPPALPDIIIRDPEVNTDPIIFKD